MCDEEAEDLPSPALQRMAMRRMSVVEWGTIQLIELCVAVFSAHDLDESRPA